MTPDTIERDKDKVHMLLQRAIILLRYNQHEQVQELIREADKVMSNLAFAELMRR